MGWGGCGAVRLGRGDFSRWVPVIWWRGLVEFEERVSPRQQKLAEVQMEQKKKSQALSVCM